MTNNDYEQGMLTSIVAGVNAVSPGMEALLIIPGDHPMIHPTTINSVLAAYSESEKGIAVPVHRGQRGHPAIFSLTYRDELLELTGHGARQLLRNHPCDVLEVPVDSEEVLMHIDTFADYHRARSYQARNLRHRVKPAGE